MEIVWIKIAAKSIFTYKIDFDTACVSPPKSVICIFALIPRCWETTTKSFVYQGPYVERSRVYDHGHAASRAGLLLALLGLPEDLQETHRRTTAAERCLSSHFSWARPRRYVQILSCREITNSEQPCIVHNSTRSFCGCLAKSEFRSLLLIKSQ